MEFWKLGYKWELIFSWKQYKVKVVQGERTKIISKAHTAQGRLNSYRGDISTCT